MAAKAEDAPPLSAATPVDSPDLGPDPEERRVRTEKRRTGRNEEAADNEARPREAKRRRTCPAALETATSSVATAAAAAGEEEESIGAVGGEFSFFFDAKGPTPIETTPKFGTFRFPVADLTREEEAAPPAVGKAEEAAEEGELEEAEVV